MIILKRKSEVVRLKGKHIFLRSLMSFDFDQWHEVRTHNTDWLLPWEPASSMEDYDPQTNKGDFASRCNAWDREREKGGGQQFGIFLPEKPLESSPDKNGKLEKPKKPGKANERFIGEMNISSIQRGVFQNCSFGYWVDERSAGMGYAPEAVMIASKYAFEVLGLHRLQIAIIPRNKPSLRVVEKLKFRYEGESEKYLKINDKWEDHKIFAMTSEEYQDRRQDLASEWLEPSLEF